MARCWLFVQIESIGFDEREKSSPVFFIFLKIKDKLLFIFLDPLITRLSASSFKGVRGRKFYIERVHISCLYF